MAKAITRLEKGNIQNRLEAELKRLKRMLEIDDGLRVVWLPDGQGNLA